MGEIVGVGEEEEHSATEDEAGEVTEEQVDGVRVDAGVVAEEVEGVGEMQGECLAAGEVAVAMAG